MSSFKDGTGHEWPLRRITIGDYDALAGLGLDLEAVAEDFGKLAALMGKPRTFAALLWWFVEAAVTKAGISPADFHQRLDGDTLAAAFTAVRDQVVDSFPYPPATKARLMSRLTEATNRAWAAADGSVDGSTNSPASPASTPAP